MSQETNEFFKALSEIMPNWRIHVPRPGYPNTKQSELLSEEANDIMRTFFERAESKRYTARGDFYFVNAAGFATEDISVKQSATTNDIIITSKKPNVIGESLSIIIPTQATVKSVKMKNGMLVIETMLAKQTDVEIPIG